MAIGDFILECRNARIGLLFQSELNEDNKLLQEYEERGVTMVSIVDDTTCHMAAQGISVSNYKVASPMLPTLRNLARGKVILFAGMRYAPVEGTYLSVSTVMAESKAEIGGFSVVNDGCLAVVVRLP